MMHGIERSAVSARRHLACIVRVSVDNHGPRCTLCKSVVSILECRSLWICGRSLVFFSDSFGPRAHGTTPVTIIFSVGTRCGLFPVSLLESLEKGKFRSFSERQDREQILARATDKEIST